MLNERFRSDPSLSRFLLLILGLVVGTAIWLTLRQEVLYPVDLLSWMYPFHGMPEFQSVLPFIPNRGYQDITYVSYQGMMMTGEAVKSGALPMWNPLDGAGQPLGGQHGVGAWFPLRWLTFTWLSPLAAWNVESVIQAFAASTGAFLLFRLYSGSSRAATFGALAWLLAGWQGAYFVQTTTAWPSVFLPWVLYGIEQVYRDKAWGIPLISIPTGLILITGHLQQSTILALTVGLYWLFRPSGQRLRVFLALVAGVLLGLPHLVQIGELAVLSQRPKVPPEVILETLFAPREYIGFLIQNFAGTPADGFYLGRSLASMVNDAREHALYIGQLMVVLAVFAVVRMPSRIHKIILGSIVGMLVLFSSPALYAPLMKVLPPLKFLTPTRYMTSILFGVCYLGTMGFAALEKEGFRPREWGAVLGTVSAFLVCSLAFIWPATTAPYNLAAWFLELARGGISKPPYFEGSFGEVITGRLIDHFSLLSSSMWLPLLTLTLMLGALRFLNGRRRFFALLGLTLLDLGLYFFSMNTPVPREQFFPTSPGLEVLQKERTFSPEFDRIPSRIISLGRGMHPNVPMSYGIANIESYASLHSAVYRRLFERLNRGGIELPHQLASVTTPLNLHPGTLDVLGVSAVHNQPRGPQDGLLFVHEREGALRAFLSNRWQVMGEEETVDHIFTAEFNPREAVLLDREPSFPSVWPGVLEPLSAKYYGFNNVRFEVESAQPCLLVLTDLDYPGWRAYVNGEEQPILRAYGFARAVELPAGKAEVVFQFRPTGFPLIIGGVILGFLLCFGLTLQKRKSGG